MQANQNTANAGLAQSTMAGQQNLLGNVVGGVGSALGLAEGGKVPKTPASSASQVPALTTYADGGMTQAGTYGTIDYSDPFAKQAAPQATPAPSPVQAAPAPMAAAQPMPAAVTPAPQVTTQQPAQAGPKSNAGKILNGQQPKLIGMALAGNTIGQGIGKGLSALFGSSKQAPASTAPDKSEVDLQNQLLQHDSYEGKKEQTPADNADIPSTQDGTLAAAHGGKVPALVSPGEIYVKPKDVHKVAKGANPEKVGKKIPGTPKVKGAVNSYANDTVKTKLDEGGIVIPRSITQGPNPHWNAMKFVHATMAKNKGKL
jgi:hypothetical protein